MKKLLLALALVALVPMQAFAQVGSSGIQVIPPRSTYIDSTGQAAGVIKSPLVLAGDGAVEMSGGVFTARDGANMIVAFSNQGSTPTFQFLTDAGAYTTGRLEASTLILNGFSGGNVSIGGHTVFVTDNAQDVGRSGTKPRLVHTGASVVASLPTCDAATKQARYFVTDANAAHTAGIGAIVAGGGANNVPVVCDGTNWRIG